MPKRIVIIQGHPDTTPNRFCRVLARSYGEGARSAGHEVRTIDVAELNFDLLRSQLEWQSSTPAPDIQKAQQDIFWAEHLLIVYPLWLGGMPALLKGFLEQAFRPGFAVSGEAGGTNWKQLLKGRSSRIVVTMGMPAFIYRWYFGAHSLKSLERNILKFVGIGPIRETIIGSVAAKDGTARAKWIERLENFGRLGS